MTDQPTSEDLDDDEVEESEATRLRPNWLVRVSILLPFGPVMIAAAIAPWTFPGGTGLDIALVVCTVCLYAIVRWVFFMGVRRDGAHLVVTGAWWSRRIPLSQVERITDLTVFIWWRTRTGRRRFTPLVAFTAQEGSIEIVARRNRWAIAEIRQWVEQDRLMRDEHPASR